MTEAQRNEDAAGIVTDAILGGKLKVRQWRKGHRAGTDAVLLAAVAPLQAEDRFIDVGCGVGTVGLALMVRAPDATGLLLDDDAAVLDLARDNCRLNGLETRLSVVRADLFDAAACRAAGIIPERATLVVTNPPFFRGDEMRASSHPAKARAYALGRDGRMPTHGDWLRSALAMLAPHGRFCTIHRPDALPDLLGACAGRLGAIEITPILARRDGRAVRILLAGVKGSRAPLNIHKAIILHEDDGRFTAEAEALHRGESARFHPDPTLA